MGDLADAVVLVTGATDGIGRAAAVRLAGRGATVLVHGRDAGKAERTLAAVRDASGPAGEAYLADFADRDAVWELARRVRADRHRLDVLVNNAGTWQPERRDADGWEGVEYTFAVNHLAPFLLSILLVAPLRAGAPSRVVTVSSGLHRRGDLSDLDAVIDPPDYDGRQAYADSKLANVLFTYELADRLQEGVAAHALHPGTVPATSLARDASGLSRLAWKAVGLLPFVTDAPQDGARTVEYAATSPDLAGRTGEYVVGERTRRSGPQSYDEELQAELWERSAELAGVSPEVPAVDPLSE